MGSILVFPIIGALIIVGLLLIPSKIYFPLAGVFGIVVGVICLFIEPPFGILMLLAGAGALAYGLRVYQVETLNEERECAQTLRKLRARNRIPDLED